MTILYTWLYIILAVGVALSANSISVIWGSKENWQNIWLIPLILISPLVFITFGLSAARIGVVVSSGTIDSILTVTTILVGLFMFNEWNTINIYQYFGIGLIIFGIVLIHLYK